MPNLDDLERYYREQHLNKCLNDSCSINEILLALSQSFDNIKEQCDKAIENFKMQLHEMKMNEVDNIESKKKFTEEQKCIRSLYRRR